jgi:hypothetical protein
MASSAPASRTARETLVVMFSEAVTKATYASPMHWQPGERVSGVSPSGASGNEHPETASRRKSRRGSWSAKLGSSGSGGSGRPTAANWLAKSAASL